MRRSLPDDGVEKDTRAQIESKKPKWQSVRKDLDDQLRILENDRHLQPSWSRACWTGKLRRQGLPNGLKKGAVGSKNYREGYLSRESAARHWFEIRC